MQIKISKDEALNPGSNYSSSRHLLAPTLLGSRLMVAKWMQQLHSFHLPRPVQGESLSRSFHRSSWMNSDWPCKLGTVVRGLNYSLWLKQQDLEVGVEG